MNYHEVRLLSRKVLVTIEYVVLFQMPSFGGSVEVERPGDVDWQFCGLYNFVVNSILDGSFGV